jgi:hypothetical protein
MYPYEVLRNGLQSSRTYDDEKLNNRKLISNIYNKRGINGFYYGFTLNLLEYFQIQQLCFVSMNTLLESLLEGL